MTDPFAYVDQSELVKDTDISWDSPHHTIGRGSTQAAAGNHKHGTRMNYFNRNLATYVDLVTDVPKNIKFNYESSSLSNTAKAVRESTVGTAPNDYSLFTFLDSGIYAVKFEASVAHDTAGTHKGFLTQGVQSTGYKWSIRSTCFAAAANVSYRLIHLHGLLTVNVGDTFYMQIMPLSAPGWDLTYCNLTITQAAGISDIRADDSL